MPPRLSHKRLQRTPPPKSSGQVDGRVAEESRKQNGKSTPVAQIPARKSSLWETLDSASTKGSAEKTRAALRQMQEDQDDSSSLSSLSDSDFKGSPATKRQKTNHNSDDSDDEEDMVFEDVPSYEEVKEPEPELQDIQISWYEDGRAIPLASELGKKGASKKQKALRISTHCMHVQFLLWHNAVRNSWLCDQEVQAIMLSHLPPRLWDEVDRWKRNSGLEASEKTPSDEARVERSAKGKGKKVTSRPTRDWSKAADRLENGVPDMSNGDPLFRLMKVLVSWWKQRFRTTAPGLRKVGYMNARRLGKLMMDFKKEEYDPEKFGERVENIEKFRQLAQDCVGSRDVGAQLFTALLRGLGLEARMISNIQPLGFGWSKSEEADEEKTNVNKPQTSVSTSETAQRNDSPRNRASRKAKRSITETDAMDLDDFDDWEEPIGSDENDSSVVDVIEHTRLKRPRSKVYDKDLEFPHYWTEVLSPVTNKYLAVDPIVKSIVCTSRDLVESLEPRGGKADKAKEVMAYCVGFSQDGTAKDVTVRYLKKQIFPGKTKGVRLPEEKIPVYNKHGKVKRYDQFNWFKSVMRGYTRGGKQHPITEVDELEESTDLKPAKLEKKEVKEGEETLQYYKTSKEYVLQRHLKREEALLPDAVPVKVFRIKGKGNKVEEENVYLRKDVVTVKSAETWHKQGRAPIAGAEPLKHAPYRAATTNRRREIAEAEAASGQKVLQPLYSYDQTDWIIPDPIKDGIIPKNEYGNIDMFAEHMCPEGAVHVPYRGTVRVCKRLEIDYAEAVVGFEFGHRMAVPVIQGVVIAQENYDRLMEELEKDEAEKARKEDEKRRKAALNTWRRFLMGLRVVERIREDYGHLDEDEPVDVFGRGSAGQKVTKETAAHDEDMAGGFLPEEYEDAEEAEISAHDDDMAGGFLPEGYEEQKKAENEEPRQTSAFFATPNAYDEDDEGEDPFQVEYHGHKTGTEPIQVQNPNANGSTSEFEVEPEDVPAKKPKRAAPKPKPKPRRSTRQRTRNKQVESSAEEEDDDDFMLSDNDD